MRPAVFFDRDNTLIESAGYLADPAEVRLIEDAAEAVARVRGLGFAVVVASNQSGVARGLFGEEQVHAVNRRIEELLRAAHPGAAIDRHEFCPFHPEALVERYRKDSELRKPRPGMLLRAAAELGLDLSRSWMIGDAPRDVEAGLAAGCRTILIRGPRLKTSPAAAERVSVQPDEVVATLAQAVRIIAARLGRESSSPAGAGAGPESGEVRSAPPLPRPRERGPGGEGR
jgi:histidinol-phosphate phosphatase family protein